ncbi:MAG: cytochrome b/b6 domain-containing protein [Burkholderiales bacterium]|nr:cytochrome b/b6 domain-containing protein [Burkholderiales bacterium]
MGRRHRRALQRPQAARRGDPARRPRSARLPAAARRPAPEPTITRWQDVASRLNHWGMYALLVCVPVAGYVGISLFPALDVFGLFALPGVVAPDKEAAKTAFAVHALLALLLVLLVGMHVAAALFHYLVRRDNVLGRMIPRLLRRA